MRALQHPARAMLAIVLCGVLLLSGCVGQRQYDEFQEWAQQRPEPTSLRVTTQSGVFGGVTGAWVRASFNDRASAESFATASREFRDELSRQFGLALRLTWPVDGGTVTLHDQVGSTPADAWSVADLPLPPTATERRVGWYSEQRYGVIYDDIVWYLADDLIEAGRAAPGLPNAALMVAEPEPSGQSVRAETPDEMPARLDGVEALRDSGLPAKVTQTTVLVDDRGDIIPVVRLLGEDVAWSVTGSFMSVKTGEGAHPYYEQAERWASDPEVSSIDLSRDRVGVGYSTPDGCLRQVDATVSPEPTRFFLRCTVSHGDDNRTSVRAYGEQAEVRRVIPGLLEAARPGLSELALGEEITVTMSDASNWPAVAADLRAIGWEGERLMRVRASAGTVLWTSTSDGQASDPRGSGGTPSPGTDDARLIEIWDASA